MLVGVISDTHGLLIPEATRTLTRVDHILHAGDVGNYDFLDTLRSIAPVTAIRGNLDTYGPCSTLPATEIIELEDTLIYMLHSIADLDLNPSAAGINVVIYGHSHQPSITHKNNILYLNPGSAGPRRFSLPVTLALLHLENGTARAEIIDLLT